MKRLNENKIIKNILENSKLKTEPKYPANLDLIKGIGDDAAYWKDDKFAYCTSTDSLVENVHFKLNYFTPTELGRKSVAVNLSDIAAMGATPLGMLINLGITKSQDEEWINDFYKGVFQLSESYNSPVLGGDLVYSSTLFISITCFGYRELKINGNKDVFMDRSKLQDGDLLYVTGYLGDSKAGLEILNSNLGINGESTHHKELIRNHIYKSPRVEAGLKLLNNGVKNCIDISDGLLVDAKRLASASKIDINIIEDSLPISNSLKLVFPDNYKKYALIGGEDYELLFSAPKSKKNILVNIFANLNVNLSVIGEICKGEGEIFVDGNLSEITGWDHFDFVL